jgi:hypothetical protein
LTSQFHCDLRFFPLSTKHCACHEKVQPRHTKPCTCHEKWCRQKMISASQKSHAFHKFDVLDLQHLHLKCKNIAPPT